MPAGGHNSRGTTSSVTASGSLKGLLAPADLSVALLDRDGTIVGVNRAWREFAAANDGVPESVGPGANYFDVCRDSDPAGVEIGRRLERLAAGEERAFVAEYPCHSPNRQRWFSMHAGRVGGDDFDGLVVTHVDISDTVLDRLRYGREHALLGRILDDVPKGVFWKDAGLRYEGANRAFTELAGLGAEHDLVGLTDDDLPLSRKLVQALASAQRQVIETGAAVENAEFALTLNGERRVISASVSPLYDADGIVGLVGVLSDISESVARVREAHDLRRYRMLAHVAAAVAHELNTPVQYVRGNLEFLETAFATLADRVRTLSPGEQTTGAADYDPCIEDIAAALADATQGVEQMSSSVQSLLQYAPYPDEQARTIDLNLGLRGLVPVLKNKWPHLASVMLDLDERLPTFRQTGGGVTRAVYALLDNAAEAMLDHEDARILLTTRCVDDRIEILVSDTGPGIPKALQEKIFLPFFSTRDPGGRRGFGLTVAREAIVDQHGGTLTVQSTREGGTTFRITLPCAHETGGVSLLDNEAVDSGRRLEEP